MNKSKINIYKTVIYMMILSLIVLIIANVTLSMYEKNKQKQIPIKKTFSPELRYAKISTGKDEDLIKQKIDKIKELEKITLEYKKQIKIKENEKRKKELMKIDNEKKKKNVEKKSVKSFVATITAYTSNYESTGKTPNHPAYGVTASGRKVERYVTAACPPSIELGTWIKIEGLGKRRCDDRGSAIKGKRFDVYMKHVDDAIEFGKQERTVWILN